MSNFSLIRPTIAVTAIALALAGCAGERPVNPAGFSQSGNMSYPLPLPQGNVVTTPTR